MVLGDRTVGDIGGEAVPVIDTFALFENLCEATMLRDAAFVLLTEPDAVSLAERAALSVGSGDARCELVELPVPTPPVLEPYSVALPCCEIVAKAGSEGVGGREAEARDEPETEADDVLLKEALGECVVLMGALLVAESAGALESEGEADAGFESAALTLPLGEAHPLAPLDAVDESEDDAVGLVEGDAASDGVSIALTVADEVVITVGEIGPVGDEDADEVAVDVVVDVAVASADAESIGFDVALDDKVDVCVELVVAVADDVDVDVTTTVRVAVPVGDEDANEVAVDVVVDVTNAEDVVVESAVFEAVPVGDEIADDVIVAVVVAVADDVAVAAQSDTFDAPLLENDPGGHAVALTELNGQYEPAGQRTGAPEEQ